MKRLVSYFLMLILISSVALGTSAETSLEAGQSKSWIFGPVTYEVKVAKIFDHQVEFIHAGERSDLLTEGASFKFSNGVAISVDEFIEINNEVKRVKFVMQVPTTECGRFRCVPGERCGSDGCELYCGNGYCDEGELNICKEDCVFCGNDKCDKEESCSTCTEDCGCDAGFECMEDSCVEEKEVKVVAAPVPEEIPEEVVEQKNIFARFWDWLKGLFS